MITIDDIMPGDLRSYDIVIRCSSPGDRREALQFLESLGYNPGSLMHNGYSYFDPEYVDMTYPNPLIHCDSDDLDCCTNAYNVRNMKVIHFDEFVELMGESEAQDAISDDAFFNVLRG